MDDLKAQRITQPTWLCLRDGHWSATTSIGDDVYTLSSVIGFCNKVPWNAFLLLNGVIVHTSEHGDRNEAMLEAGNAFRRAAKLRMGKKKT